MPASVIVAYGMILLFIAAVCVFAWTVGPIVSKKEKDAQLNLKLDAPATTDEIASGVNIRRTDIKRVMDDLSARGTARRQPVPRTDKAGRHVSVSAWVLSNQASWLHLHTSTSMTLVVGDLDGDGRADIVINFGALGLWEYGNSGWKQLHTLSPDVLAIGHLNPQ